MVHAPLLPKGEARVCVQLTLLAAEGLISIAPGGSAAVSWTPSTSHLPQSGWGHSWCLSPEGAGRDTPGGLVYTPPSSATLCLAGHCWPQWGLMGQLLLHGQKWVQCRICEGRVSVYLPQGPEVCPHLCSSALAVTTKVNTHRTITTDRLVPCHTKSCVGLFPQHVQCSVNDSGPIGLKELPSSALSARSNLEWRNALTCSRLASVRRIFHFTSVLPEASWSCIYVMKLI